MPTVARTTISRHISEFASDVAAIERKAVASLKSIVKVNSPRVAAKRMGMRVFLGKLVRPLAELSSVSYLSGKHREQINAQKASTISAGLYDDAIKYLQKVTSTSNAELEDLYAGQIRSALQKLDPALRRRLEVEVNSAISKGLPTEKAVEVISKDFSSIAEYHLETIFRTQTQLAYNAGRWKADQDEAIQEILWGYYYSTVGDDRVRPSHEACDGVTLPKDDPFWERFWPPNGWNCRCAVISLFSPEEIVRPPLVDSDGEPIAPDPGFGMNPGVG